MIIEFLGAAILICICAFLLKSLGSRTAAVFSALCTVIILIEGVGRVSGLLASLFGVIPAECSDVIGACLKVVGAGYLFGATADVCRTLSETEIAKAVEVVGRVEIILIVLPFVKEIIDMGAELL